MRIAGFEQGVALDGLAEGPHDLDRLLAVGGHGRTVVAIEGDVYNAEPTPFGLYRQREELWTSG